MNQKRILYIVFIILVIMFCALLYHGITIDYEKNAENALEKKYKTDFIYIDSIIDNNSEIKKYHFYSPDNSLIVTAYYNISYNSGQINILLPFYIHTVFHDDLCEVIQQKVIESEFGNVGCIVLNYKNMDDISNKILLSLNKLHEMYNTYHIDTALHKPYIYLGFQINSSIKYEEFYENNLLSIKNKLNNLMIH